MIAGPPVWVTELAARFWAAVGDPPPFPRDLRDVLCWHPTLRVFEVPNLTTGAAAAELASVNIRCPFRGPDRPLAGCFAGDRGAAAVVLDPTLDPAEVRFTAAHEVAHYLRDYDAPRRKVLARLGPGALAVLDGDRPATLDERLAGVLCNVPIGPHAHFFDRDRRGHTTTAEAWNAEAAADRLAFELLAPFHALGLGGSPGRAALAERLVSAFGLPPGAAREYLSRLTN